MISFLGGDSEAYSNVGGEDFDYERIHPSKMCERTSRGGASPRWLAPWSNRTPFGQETTTQGSQTKAQPPPAAPSPWSFRLSPYLWLAGVSGRVGVRSDLPAVDVDVGFSEIFDAIDWFPPPLMLDGEVRYGRIGFVSDFMYIGLEESEGITRGPVSAWPT